MDSYMWYTHTIHREAQERLHAHMQVAAQGWRLQQVQPRRSRRQQQVLVIIASRLIATGHWLKTYASPVRVSQ